MFAFAKRFKLKHVCTIRRYSFTSNETTTQHEQNYMRKVLQTTSGCVLYHPDKHLEYIISPKTFSETNRIISNLVAEIRKFHLQKHAKSVNQTLLTSLDEQCLESYKTWPVNERLFVLDACHSLKHVKNLSIFGVVLSDFLQNFDELTNGPALQTMYYVASSKRQFRPNEAAIVIAKLNEIVTQLTLDEVAIYCLALIKSDCDVNNVHLVRSLYSRLIASDLRQHDDIGVTGVMKAVRRFSTTDHIPDLKGLQGKLVPFAEAADLQSLTHIIQLGSKQRMFNRQLIDVIITRFLNNLDNLRVKEVERALLAISTFNQRTVNSIEMQFVDIVQKRLLMSLDTKFPTSIIRCISYLAVLGVADERLVEWALSPTTHSHAYGAAITDDEHALLLIDAYAKINLAATYKGHTLPEELCAELMPKVVETAGKSSELAHEIRDSLTRDGAHCIMSRPLPYVPFPDIFFVYNKRTHKTVACVHEIIDGRMLEASSLHGSGANLEAVAIIPCLQRQTVLYSNRYNGLFQLKLDHLKALGFKVVVIKKSIWNCYKTPEAKRRCLAIELCKNDVFLLSHSVNFVFKSSKKNRMRLE